MRITFIIVGIVAAIILIALAARAKRTGSETSAPPRSPSDKADKQIYSFVLLLKSPRTLDVPGLTAAADAAFAGQFNKADIHVRAMPKEGLFGVAIPNANLGIIRASAPYIAGEKLADAADRQRLTALKIALQQHKAWLSVDWIGPLPAGGPQEAYQPIGKLIAALLGDDVLAIYCTTPAKGHAHTSKDVDILKNGDPLALFDLPPEDKIVTATDDMEAQLAAAEAEAKRRWPEFVKAFNARRPMQGFAVKKHFTANGKSEHMWVELSVIDGNSLRGKLANDPGIITSLKLNDPVMLTVDEIEDWIYSDGKQMIGGFSASILDRSK